jgi:hypothetical protein
LSREYDPETDQMPDDDSGGDVERPIPVPPVDPMPAPIEEPPDAPNVPDEPDPEPIGDPAPTEPTRLVFG